MALDHHYAGIASVAVERTDGVEQADLDAWLASEGLPPVFEAGPVASCSAWTAVPRDDMTSNAPMDLGSPPLNDRSILQVFFLEDDPRTCWDRFVGYGTRVEASGLGRVTSAAPFFRTVVGTDNYTDQLW